MKIWIVNPYGTLPSEGWREYRSALLARALADRGHEVIWWIADFEHRSKKFRKNVTVDALLPERVQIRCIASGSYKRHIGIRRVLFEIAFGRAVAAAAQLEAPPHAIVVAEPALFFGAPVRKFALENEVPLIVDVLDLWPELFHVVLPRGLRGMGRVIFSPLYSLRKKMIDQSAGVVVVARNYLDILLSDGASKKSGTFYIGVRASDFQRSELRNERSQHLPFEQASDKLTVIYAGTLGEAYDIPTLCEAARELINRGAPIRFIFAGAGPMAQEVSQLAADYPKSVVFAGPLPADELLPYYKVSDVGLCSYAQGSTVSMPLKVFDYLASGLAIVSSLGGDVKDILNSGCGVQYKAESVQDLVRKLDHLSKNSELVISMKLKSRSMAYHYDVSTQYGLYADFVEEVIASAT